MIWWELVIFAFSLSLFQWLFRIFMFGMAAKLLAGLKDSLKVTVNNYMQGGETENAGKRKV